MLDFVKLRLGIVLPLPPFGASVGTILSPFHIKNSPYAILLILISLNVVIESPGKTGCVPVLVYGIPL